MKRALLAIMLVALYILHQDFWFWRKASPLVFGFLPIGLFYHACYTVVVALVLLLLVRRAWPSELEAGLDDGETGRGGDQGARRQGDGVSGREGEARTSRPVASSPTLPVNSTERGDQP